MREHQLLGRDVPASPKAFEHYLRANEVCYDPAQWGAALALYQRCLEEDPRYAPAWARLGRMHRVFAKFVDDDHRAGLERAEHAFSRALEINPDLPLAHNLYAYLKIDRGRAEEAMTGLIARAKRTASDAELFAGLVQACRVCGLLRASAAAHDRARALDGHVATSVGYTYFWLNDYERLEALALPAFDQYLLALADVRRSQRGRAIARLTAIANAQKAVTSSGAPRIRDIALMLKAAILRRRRECLEATARILHRLWDAEGFYFMASACAQVGDQDRAIDAYRWAVEAGFLNHPAVEGDPWLQRLRGRRAFDDLVEHTRRRHLLAAAAFVEAGGDQLLGLSGEP
jgi:tetratricopeptide (TPR) repeat protein